MASVCIEADRMWKPTRLYIRGVGVGLIIAWVTSAIAYYRGGLATYTTLIAFEFALSIIFLAISLLMKKN